MVSLAVEENENETVYFLSHYQAEGGTVARDIYYSMKEKGIKCWLDVKMREQDEDAMREGVKLCEVVLIIMSPNYFTRPFCVKELEWAVEFGKPIVVVIDAMHKGEIGNILSICPPHLRGIGSINFISIVPGTIDLWETSIKLILRAKPKILKRNGSVVAAVAKGTFTFDDGSVYTGDLMNGKPNGIGEIKYEKKQKSYVGEVKDGKPDGKGKCTWVLGGVYEGDHKDGKINGKGKYTWVDGSVYEGDCKDDKRHGKGKKTYEDGSVYEGDWKDDKRHGKGKWTLANGVVHEGKWDHGKFIG